MATNNISNWDVWMLTPKPAAHSRYGPKRKQR